MKLIIDIPENIYDTIMDDQMLSREQLEILHHHIYYGQPLPKGHGRLIDADAVIAEAIEKMKYPVNHKYMECVIAHMELAPTIIEADKEDNE